MVAQDKKAQEIYKNIPIYRKLKAAFELFDLARFRIKSELCRQNPSFSNQEIDKLVLHRLYKV